MNRIIYNVTGQTLSHYPMTRVASATYVLERLDRTLDEADRTIASGSATVDAVSTTTDLDAGPAEAMARKIPLVSTTGIVAGKRYELVDASGIAEAIEVDTIVTDDYVLATHDLMGSYASGATFQGLEITAPMDDTTAQDEDFVDGSVGPLRLTWKYTVEGKLTHQQDMVPMVRHSDGDIDLGESVALVGDAFPDILQRCDGPTKLHQWAKFCQRDIERRIRTKGDDPAQYLMGDQGTMVLMWRIVLHAADNGIAPGNREIDGWADEARRRFDGAWDGIMGGHAGNETMDVDKGEDTAPNTPSVKHRGTLTFGG